MAQMDKPTVMAVVDDERLLLLINEALSDAYRVVAPPNAARVMDALDLDRIDMLMLDARIPGIDDFSAAFRLVGDKRTHSIPVVFVPKPFSPQLLRRRADMRFELERRKSWVSYQNQDITKIIDRHKNDVTNLQHTIITALGEMLEYSANLPPGRVAKVRRHVECLVGGMIELGVYLDEIVEWNMDFVVASAILYDLGKHVVNPAVLNKPDGFKSDDWSEAISHVHRGEDLLSRLMRQSGGGEFLEHAKKFAAFHHERWDGGGYPYGLKGTAIPLEGRMMAIVDTYNALTSKRPHRTPLSHGDAVNTIAQSRGAQFDPTLVDVFLHVQETFRVPR